ncbi:ASPIC/UnbV domain-containing protein [Candidatus Uabimicrobium amorphum]|uniref:RTX toxin n=1 Tax=Uabimicrobium amorphum TaxID=2596890 RepID=A0A5S9IVE9_UABAM|nr:ASPIC/UnbV domain-containing protein [Candidatus Uabimicrobium amorphum]BBM88316.1 RTX toxin [Candidatus Uabimicrobium amorphum]
MKRTRYLLEKGDSLSGQERNHFFLNRKGQDFDDISLLSGVNHIGDSRSFAKWDYNRDGKQDIVLVNRNAPSFRIYTNNIDTSNKYFVALRFVGGNHSAQPSKEWSSRDAYGTRVKVTLPDTTLIRELRCGEGYGAQNSSTLIIGIGNNKVVPKIEIFWPSSKQHRWENIKAGSLAIFKERLEEPIIEKYHKETQVPEVQKQKDILSLQKVKRKSKLTLFVSMATWCSVCKKEIPYLKKIRKTFSTKDIEIVGVPTSEKDDIAKLKSYVKQYSPPYKVYFDITADNKKNIARVFEKYTGVSQIFPSYIIINSANEVLEVDFALPSISKLHGLLDENESNTK